MVHMQSGVSYLWKSYISMSETVTSSIYKRHSLIPRPKTKSVIVLSCHTEQANANTNKNSGRSRLLVVCQVGLIL